jgi:CheY-like chemotaxis protein
MDYAVAGANSADTMTGDLQMLRGKRLLLIEDSIADQRWLTTMLADCGMAITHTETAAQARQLFAQQQFDLVLLDLYLQDESGIDLLPWLIKQQPQAAVLVITAAGTASDATQCSALGAKAFLHKPISKHELHEALLLMNDQPASAQHQSPFITGKHLKLAREKLKVLVAEDNAVNQMLAQALLEQMGHSVTLADDGAAALRSFSNQGFDLILMDMHMPEMNGVEATRAIRQRELQQSLGRTPIIALTANAMTEAVSECLSAGMDGYVCKPIRTELLAQEIERVMATLPPMQAQAG